MNISKRGARREIFVNRPITRITLKSREEIDDIILLEDSYHLYCNDKFITELHCSPVNLEQLALGHLFCRHMITQGDQVDMLSIEYNAGKICVTTHRATTTPTVKEETEIRLTADQVHKLQADFNSRCDLFRATGAMHACALANQDGLILFLEDIARHNALDKVIGEMLLQNIPPDGKALIFSGRMASDMMEKSWCSGVRLLIAPGAPSLTSVKLAEERGLTLLGFVRPDNINIYSHPHRVV
ncbi:MAG: formate dehydrogenase accessory sulfurtransferase FdhD [Deltaproteobacteria bacterium]|jgi:FdhD protein|nr:formate dehydrogenase accessory sulfurtransferase FdhD [Deltaproteobacteria bacterium]